MQIYWSDFAIDSLAEIIVWYELEAGEEIALSIKKRILQQITVYTIPPLTPDSLQNTDIIPNTKKLIIKNLPYIAYLHKASNGDWEIVDIVHTSRKLPK